MSKQQQEATERKKRVKQIVTNIDTIHKTYGYTVDITLCCREKTNTYGLMDKGLILYSKVDCVFLSRLTQKHTPLSIELLSSISEQIEKQLG